LSVEKKYKDYTATDIEKYHKGLMSFEEMHALEKAALDDPFLSDAIEGFKTNPVNIGTDLDELKIRLEKKIGSSKVVAIPTPRRSPGWWRAAAAVVIIGGIAFLTFRISTNNNKDSSIAKLEEKKSNEPAATPRKDSIKLERNDRTTVKNINQPVPSATVLSPKKKMPAPVNSENDKNKNDVAGILKTTRDTTFINTKKANDDSKDVSALEGNVTPAAKSTKNDGKVAEGLFSMKKANALREQQKMNYFHGRVADTNNNPLPFANITNTQDNVGTYADAQGTFTLISPDSVLNVQVRSVGFQNNLALLKNNVTNNRVILQEDKSAPDRIISYQKPDSNRSKKGSMKFEEPEPADGWVNYNTYLANNINLPEDLKINQARRNVELSFEVNQAGEAVHIKVEKSLCEKCDEEAIRLVKQGPKWKKKNKKPNRITISVPFDKEQ